MQEPLSPRQEAALQFIRGFYVEHGYPPSLAEVAIGLGVARSTAQAHVDALQAKGYLSREPGRGRALALPGAAWPDAGACVEFAQEYAVAARLVTADPWAALRRRAVRALGVRRR